ncbi:MAG: HAMP domain-containing histidine kinase [Bacteroidales bacterium]|nr:HAMP domain-containing histidine kinase [Bacteroidales bacterium]
MDIYTKKRRWKLILISIAIAIVGFSIWYTNFIVRKFAIDERTDVRIWADAIQRKAKLVKYTELFFDQIKVEEQKRAEILAGAYKNIANNEITCNLNFYVDIIKNNTTIPVVVTNENDKISSFVNYEFESDTITYLSGELKEEFTENPPIKISWVVDNEINSNYLYYKESRLFSELRQVLDDLVQSFFSEVVTNSASVPVVVTDSTQREVIAFGNVDSLQMQDSVAAGKLIEEMQNENDPIKLDLPEQGTTYIFYKDSALLTQISFFPYLQFGVIGLFLIIAYFLFSSARRAEQNQVWVGMSKETAHQIGTPLSSIMAWLELLKMKGVEDDAISEIEKDVGRLEKITDRFSKIGSPAKLKEQNIVEVIRGAIEYFKSRSSKKVKYKINSKHDAVIVPINLHLFEWVIENLSKNAVDAMGGSGVIIVDITEEAGQVVIDFADTGKGIPKSMHKSIFNPGFTSKKRGWGLGLTLSQRIIKDYHKGKIFVRNSAPGEGTTFRIVLRK